MSDDLVKRLRYEADGAEFSNRYADLVGEAADRIEALEAALEKADALAAALCAEEKTAGQDVWAKLDACEVTDNALTASRAAREAVK